MADDDLEFEKYSELRKLSPGEDTANADAEHVPQKPQSYLSV
jgi:hypothetical protein